MTDPRVPDEAVYRAQSNEDLIDSLEFLATLRDRLKTDSAFAAKTAAMFTNGVVDVEYCELRIALINQILLERVDAPEM